MPQPWRSFGLPWVCVTSFTASYRALHVFLTLCTTGYQRSAADLRWISRWRNNCLVDHKGKIGGTPSAGFAKFVRRLYRWYLRMRKEDWMCFSAEPAQLVQTDRLGTGHARSMSLSTPTTSPIESVALAWVVLLLGHYLKYCNLLSGPIKRIRMDFEFYRFEWYASALGTIIVWVQIWCSPPPGMKNQADETLSRI